MKSCSTCNRTFEDTLTYCLVDGSILSAPFDPTKRNSDPPATEIMPSKAEPDPTLAAPSPVSPPRPTIPAMFQQAPVTPVRADGSWAPARSEQKRNLLPWIIAALALLVVIGIGIAFVVFSTMQPRTANQGLGGTNASLPTPASTATPDEAKVHRDRGNAFKAAKRYTEAETEFREAIRLNPRDVSAHANLAESLDRQNREAEALPEYREALRLKPDMEPAWAAALHYNIGKALYDQKKYAEAESEYREAIRLDPNLGMAHQALGSALFQQSRYSEAETALREAVRLNPNEVAPHNNLAVVLEKQNKTAEARAEHAKVNQLKNKTQ